MLIELIISGYAAGFLGTLAGLRYRYTVRKPFWVCRRNCHSVYGSCLCDDRPQWDEVDACGLAFIWPLTAPYFGVRALGRIPDALAGRAVNQRRAREVAVQERERLLEAARSEIEEALEQR